MNLLRFLLCLSLPCASALAVSADFYADCRVAIALKGVKIGITVIAEKSSDSAKKRARIAHANRGKSYLGVETIPFGKKKSVTFPTSTEAIRVVAHPHGPLFGVEDPDTAQVQDMAMALMWWDVHLSKPTLTWDQAKVDSIVKFVVATQHDPGRWLRVQSQNRYRTKETINHLRALGTIEEMLGAMAEGVVPDLNEFRDMLRAWGEVATLAVASVRPEHWDQLVIVAKFFKPDGEGYDATEVLSAIGKVRQALISLNLARFAVGHLNSPKPIFVVLTPRNAEPVANILRANLEASGVTVTLER